MKIIYSGSYLQTLTQDMDLQIFKKKMQNKAEHLFVTLKDKNTGKSIRFTTPSETPLWRAQTLFTKELVTIEWIRSFDSDKIFFDVGANVGVYSIFSAIISGVRVFSFEPESNNFQILMENILLNNLKNKITAYPLGLGNKTELTKLYLSSFVQGSSHHNVGEAVDHNLKPRKFDYEQCIFSTSLNDLINKWKLPVPNYLKIDVDGLEYKIIEESLSILNNHHLESVLIEINPNRKEDEKIINTFTACGFSYDKQQIEKATRLDGPHKGYAEYLFFRK